MSPRLKKGDNDEVFQKRWNSCYFETRIVNLFLYMLDLESQLFEKGMFLSACDLVENFYTRCKRHDDDSHDVNLCVKLFLALCCL